MEEVDHRDPSLVAVGGRNVVDIQGVQMQEAYREVKVLAVWGFVDSVGELEAGLWELEEQTGVLVEAGGLEFLGQGEERSIRSQLAAVLEFEGNIICKTFISEGRQRKSPHGFCALGEQYG